MSASTTSIERIYRYPVIFETLDLEDLWVHVPEVENPWRPVPNQRIKVKVLGRVQNDYRRYWQLAIVTLDDRPLGLIQNAGRSGQDFVGSYFTDEKLYREMLTYLQSIMPIDQQRIKFCDAAAELPNLLDFYSQSYGDAVSGTRLSDFC